MSPGSTMERVYLELKARIVAGTYPPGTRLDAENLARALSTSSMPVREALDRLAGERIVDSWHQEGFRLPTLTEVDLRDLYDWSRSLIGLALKSPAMQPAPPDGFLAGTNRDDYPERIAQLFRAVGLLSENRELRYAIANLIERTLAFRAVEVRVDPSAGDALTLMEEDFRAGNWPELRMKNMHFHRRRIAWSARVVAALRPRPQTLG